MHHSCLKFFQLGILIIFIILSGMNCRSRENANEMTSMVSFQRDAQNFESLNTFQIALGDFDGDDDLDAVFSNMGDNYSRVWTNNGKGQFSDSGQRLSPNGHGVAIGDLDGDGDLDIFLTCASYEHRSRIYFNDGKGQFTDTNQDLTDLDLSCNAITLVDIDGDSDLDAVVFYYQAPDKIYYNDGQGIFSYSGNNAPEHSMWGDLDSDGDIDIFVREEGKGYKTMLNDGHGNFSDHWFTKDTLAIRGFAGLGDIDNDGDLDVIATNGNRTKSYPTIVFFNDGSGQLERGDQELSPVKAGRVGLGDLNADGYLDVLLTSFEQPNEIWLNRGNGTFVDKGIRLENKGAFHNPLLNDIDGDGDLDIIIANYQGGPNEIWFNVGQ